MIEKCPRDRIISSIVQEHKQDLAHRFAYMLHQTVVSQAKNCEYMRPPRLEGKDTMRAETTSTQASEEEFVLPENQAEQILQGLETQATTTKKVMHVLHAYEEHLLQQRLSCPEKIKGVRVFNRGLLAHVLGHKTDFANLPRESLALAIILLNAEKIALNKVLLLNFIAEGLQNKRISKISQIRKSRAYQLLSEKTRRGTTTTTTGQMVDTLA